MLSVGHAIWLAVPSKLFNISCESMPITTDSKEMHLGIRMWTILLSPLILSLSPGVLPTPVKILFLFFYFTSKTRFGEILNIFLFCPIFILLL